MTNAFAEERRKTNALIDEALARVRGGPRSGVVPTFEIHLRGTPSGKQAIGNENDNPSVVSRVATAVSGVGVVGATSVVTGCPVRGQQLPGFAPRND